jgi:cytochrome c-type biogenesis protein CcmH/NrfG
MSDSSSKSPSYKKIIIIVSGLVFLGSMSVLPMLGLFKGNSSEPSKAPVAQSPGAPPSQEQIKAIENGYAKVLEREPDNVTALKGLAEVRLKQGDLQGGLIPLKKLAQQFPEKKPLAELVTKIETALKNPAAVPPAAPADNAPSPAPK